MVTILGEGEYKFRLKFDFVLQPVCGEGFINIDVRMCVYVCEGVSMV